MTAILLNKWLLTDTKYVAEMAVGGKDSTVHEYGKDSFFLPK